MNCEKVRSCAEVRPGIGGRLVPGQAQRAGLEGWGAPFWREEGSWGPEKQAKPRESSSSSLAENQRDRERAMSQWDILSLPACRQVPSYTLHASRSVTDQW